MKRLLLIIVICLSSTSALQAQYWQQTGNLPVLPYSDGAYITDIVAYQNDSIFTFNYYPFASIQKIFLSSDAGKNWHSTNNETPGNGLTVISHNGTMIHANNDYQTDSAGLYRSTNFGADWVRTSDAGRIGKLVNGDAREYYATFYRVVDPYDFQFLHSTDDGVSWVQIPVKKGYFVSGIVTRPNHTLFIALYPNILRSSNSGMSWDTVFTLVNTFSDFKSFFEDHSLIYVITPDSSLYTSVSGDSNSWEKRGKAPAFSFVVSRNGLLIAPPYISHDTGMTWQIIRSDSTFRSAAIDSSGVCFLGLDDYIYRSTNSGNSWDDRVPILDEALKQTLPLLAGSQKDLWLLGTQLFYSADDGDSWGKIGSKKIHYFTCVSIAKDGSLIAGCEDSTYKYSIASTSDHGLTWKLSSPVISENAILFLGESSPGKLIAIDINGYCDYSTDNGTTWKMVQATSSSASFYSFCIADSLTVYGGGVGKFFLSHTGGTSWKSHLTPSPANIVTSIGPGYNNSILAVFDTISLMRSTDDGYSWNSWSDGIPTGLRITGIVRDADSGVYVSTSDGIFYQPHGGTSWFEATVGLTDRNVQSITSRNGKTLFVSCAHTGIFRAENIAGSVRSASELKNIISVYPNPLSSSATISYSLSHYQFTKLELLDQLGRVVRVLQEGSEDVGLKNISLTVNDLPAGMYFLRLLCDDGVISQKVVLQR